MKKNLLLISAAILLIVGCTTKNPAYTEPLAGQPDTNTVPKYIVDPKVASGTQVAGAAASISAPFNPYAVPTMAAVKFGGWIVGLGSIALAAWQNKDKKTAVAALSTIAAGAVKAGSGATQAILDHSSDSDHFAAIAQALNDATGANQTNTGAIKS